MGCLKPPTSNLQRLLLVSDLKLGQEYILGKGIGITIVVRIARTYPLVMAKLVIDRDLALDFGWQILEVVVEPHDSAGIHIVAY